MSIKLGVVMDPISKIKIVKDSTFAMLLEAQSRGWEIHYMEQHHLSMLDGVPYAETRLLTVKDDINGWFTLQEPNNIPMQDLDVVLMRKDPPFDMEFVQTTYLLERAEQLGVLIVNKPQSLRDANEKMFTAWFPQCCPPTLISRRYDQIKEFVAKHKKAVIKPLDSMGGHSIFKVSEGDDNLKVIMETVTQEQGRFVMIQQYIDEIVDGDKRILLIDGEPIPYVLARMPPPGDFRGNLAVGGTGVAREISDRDRWICEQVAPTLKEKDLIFVGLDVIGDYLTEVNVTSPTGIRELDKQFNLNISAKLMDAIEKRLAS